MQSSTSERLLGLISTAIQDNLPPTIPSAYFDDFLVRFKPAMLQVVEQQLGQLKVEGNSFEPTTVSKRTKANLKALEILAKGPKYKASYAERNILRAYTGWGGLSIEKVLKSFPKGLPLPEKHQLINEYYTPRILCEAVAKALIPVIRPMMGGTKLLALEPSAGIGRFIDGFAIENDLLSWTAVEYSPLSAQILQTLRPDVQVHAGSFESWVAQYEKQVTGRLHLVLGNPPYGARGDTITKDPNRAFRVKQAYHYFMLRSLSLLAPGGLGVFLVPYGFLTGQSKPLKALRERILKSNHLSAAYRLPSNIFAGASLVTDVLIFRSRGVSLDSIPTADEFILKGLYYKDYPEHILGREIGAEGDPETGKKARWGYEVLGTFKALPKVSEREFCLPCVVKRQPLPTQGDGLKLTDPKAQLEPSLASAEALGQRVDDYLNKLSNRDKSVVGLYRELIAALQAWKSSHGSPWKHAKLAAKARRNASLARFRAAFLKSGRLIEGLRQAPTLTARYTGAAHDLVAMAEFLYRQHKYLTVSELRAFYEKQTNSAPSRVAINTLWTAGWCRDGARWNELLPRDSYLSGDLWPRFDRAQMAAQAGKSLAMEQLQALSTAIGPLVFEEINGISPRQSWVPLALVSEWLKLPLYREDGLVKVKNTDYALLSDKDEYRYLNKERIDFVGWMNHDRSLFRPKRDDPKKSLDGARLERADTWTTAFHAWCAAEESRRGKIEEAYNRKFKGYVPSSYSSEPLKCARWTRGKLRPHAHQTAGARRLLANRGGLLAFDVGVGKTFTGLLTLAMARQEGWAKRPVVLVPNSIAFKWLGDFKKVLPDYRVAVIGAKQVRLTRGRRAGQLSSKTDTPEERAQKWTRFQAGELDAVILTYSALERTQIKSEPLVQYVEATDAKSRVVSLQRRNAEKTKNPTERQQAVLEQGAQAFVAEILELAPGHAFDPGIVWDALGIDLLIVDEAQNFKNLYMPEPREGGVPRFMGNSGDGSKRAWQLDFRCSSVRRNTGGAGVVLLSATPAKNSPLEFYNLLQLVDHTVWQRRGIASPEQFIDRYLKIEMRNVLNAHMASVEKSAVVGFQNLDELRDVLFRYGEFKTAEDVGLKLPQTKVHMIEVDMDGAQEAKYAAYANEIEETVSEGGGRKGAILGMLSRMAMVAIHSELDEKYKWGNADGVDPHSPKLDAVAKQVLKKRHCGHIIFVENTAAHLWQKQVLMEAGIPEARIAVLNGTVAKSTIERQRIAEGFNGDPEAGKKPLYDVVICNQIAYEGIDLQTRTCAIHHLDLPWEPATLQQRNGRGVRQGNTLSVIDIYYYFARRSQDGLRFNLIQGKLNWLKKVLKSQVRDTNNPMAQMDLGPEEIMLLISRDPEKTQERLSTLKAEQEAKRLAREKDVATQVMRAANARFRQAERAESKAEAARLRHEAESRLESLAQMPGEVWPWTSIMYSVRTVPVFVGDGARCPVFEGLRYQRDGQCFEFGRVKGKTIGFKVAGSAEWGSQEFKSVKGNDIKPSEVVSDCPPEQGHVLQMWIQAHLEWRGDFAALGWQQASDPWLRDVWRRYASDILKYLKEAPANISKIQIVPALVRGKLVLLTRLDGPEGSPHLHKKAVLPPTLEGWKRFLQLAPKSGLSQTHLHKAAVRWWGRNLPKALREAAPK